MVQPISMAIGTMISLRGLYSVCLQAMEQVIDAKHFGEDSQSLHTLFECERGLFNILENLQIIWANGDTLSKRYGIESDTGAVGAKQHAAEQQKKLQFRKKVAWAVKDKKGFGRLVADVGAFVQKGGSENIEAINMKLQDLISFVEADAHQRIDEMIKQQRFRFEVTAYLTGWHQHPQLECDQRQWNPTVRIHPHPLSGPRGDRKSSYQSDDRYYSYSVSMSFPGLPLDSPVNFLFQPPDCNGLIELSFPLAPDFPAGMACLIKYRLSRRFCKRYNDPGDQPEQRHLAQRTPHHQRNCNLHARRRSGHTFVQGSGPLRNSTAYGHPPYGINSTSTFQATSHGNATGPGTGTGLSLGGPPSNGTDGALDSQQSGNVSAPTLSGQGKDNGDPPATPTTPGIAGATSPGNDSLAGAALPSTLVTITTPGSPGLNGSQTGAPPDGTPTAPPGQTVDGQQIPESGGPMETTQPAAHTTGANGATGGDGPAVTTAGGGTDPGQSAAASTCRCN
ncbi:hypothetical protein Q9L58_005880 [Maublancomyces gigas]|uniref:Prion-inhibition and propagation HeLo domain-containing protein n=1 Tax=Discina gigas TaxID=1032678 RepID=A0ABR3GH91_9PEZI